MVMLNMDLNDTPSGLGFEPLPAGDYQAQIIEGEATHSLAGNVMLNLTWLIMEGEHAERHVFDRVCITGSDKAVSFGKRKVKTIAEAIGHPNPNRVEDSEELHGRPCLITIGFGKGDYADRNEVKNYTPLSQTKTARPESAAPDKKSTAPAPAAKKGAAPPPRKNMPPTESSEDVPF